MNKRHLIIAILVLLFLLPIPLAGVIPLPASAEPFAQQGENVDLVGYITLGYAGGVYVVGEHAYVANGFGGLRVISVSDPANPVEVGYYETPDLAMDVYVAREYAYVAGWGFYIISISDPANPVEVGYYDTPGGIWDVYVAGEYAYVASQIWEHDALIEGGLRIISVSDPANPVEVGYYETSGIASGVYVGREYAYVADFDKGLRVVSVSDPANPVEVGYYDTPEAAWGVYVAGEYAYVADVYGGFYVVSVSDPANPVGLGYYETSDGAEDIYVAGEYAYVADGYGGLRVISVSDPANPVEVGYYETPEGAENVYVAGEYAYVTGGSLTSGGLFILRFTGAEPTYSISGRVRDGSGNPISGVTISDGAGHAPATDSNGNYTLSGLAAGTYTITPSKSGYTFLPVSCTVSVPPNATGQDFTGRPTTDVELVGQVRGNVSAVAVQGNYAYLGMGSRLVVVDISNPSNPTVVSQAEIPDMIEGPLTPDVQDIFVSGSYGYVGAWGQGLWVIDVSNPFEPQVVGYYNFGGIQNYVFVSGSYAYVVGGDLRVIDISDPTNPYEVGYYNTPGDAVGVFVSSPYAYVADRYGGLRVLDISNPATPQEVGHHDVYSSGIFVSGSYAYVVERDLPYIIDDIYYVHSLAVVDISNPANPQKVGYLRIGYLAYGGWAQSLFVSGAYVYLAAWEEGLRVVDVSDPTSPYEVAYYDTSGTASDVFVYGPYIYVADWDGGFLILRFRGAEPTYFICGRVHDGSGNPISGVIISDGAGHTAITDSNGNYTLSELAAGTYTITPSKSGYTFSPASRTVSVPPDATGQDFTGYDKPPIVFVHGWGGFPPWGPCDWPDPSSNFKLMYDDLKAAGYYVAYAYLETSPCYTPPLVENVPRLRQAIALAKAATNQEKVILIAHSMGGVVSRAYIEGPDYDGDVAALFTFGSPHLGVPVDVFVFLANGLSLGEYCRDYQPATCDLSILGMALFNEDHPTRATGVTYHVISGDAPFLSRSAFGMALDVIIRGPDDALIPTGSGTGLSGTLDRWETDEVHSKGCGSRSYFVRDGGQSLSYVQCLKKVLVDKTSNTCGSISPLQVTAEITPTLAERIPFEYGTLLTGQTATRTISLEGGPTLFAAQWQTGTLAVTLVDPNGQTIDPAYAASHPDVVTYDADVTSATYYFPNAIAGIWQLVLQATSDIPTDGSAYTTFAAFDSLLSLTAETDRDWYAPGASATITASLSGSPASAVVTATVLCADGVTDTVSLSPLGAGQYQATYTVPDAPGYAEVRLVATGTTADSVPFERGLSLTFQISSNIVTLSGAYSDTPQPRSLGSSFYEALTITAGINAIISGTVGLSADMIDVGGNFVAHSFAIEDVTTGAGTLALRFDGDDIYVSHRNGPYTLTNLLLTDRRRAALVIAEAENVYTTAAYDYLSFASPRIYLPLILRNR